MRIGLYWGPPILDSTKYRGVFIRRDTRLIWQWGHKIYYPDDRTPQMVPSILGTRYISSTILVFLAFNPVLFHFCFVFPRKKHPPPFTCNLHVRVGVPSSGFLRIRVIVYRGLYWDHMTGVYLGILWYPT